MWSVHSREGGRLPLRPSWKGGKGPLLWEERGSPTSQEGSLSPLYSTLASAHLCSPWQVPFKPSLHFQVTMEIYWLGKSGLINAEVISRLAWGGHKSWACWEWNVSDFLFGPEAFELLLFLCPSHTFSDTLHRHVVDDPLPRAPFWSSPKAGMPAMGSHSPSELQN